MTNLDSFPFTSLHSLHKDSDGSDGSGALRPPPHKAWAQNVQRLGTFRGFDTERAKLGSFRGFATECVRLGTFRGFGTERARLNTLNRIFEICTRNEHLQA